MTLIAFLLLGAAVISVWFCAVQPDRVEARVQMLADEVADERLYFAMVRGAT